MSKNNEEIIEIEVEDSKSEEQLKKEKQKKKKKKDEADALWQAVMAGDESQLKARVASIMNRFPETRNSDVGLQIKYWEIYNGVKSDSINVNDLYDLERLTSIARTRAKIQNEYELFKGSKRVKNKRMEKAEEEKESQLSDKPSYSSINVFSDETGKNDDYVIVAGIWFLEEKSTSKIMRDYMKWTNDKKEEGQKIPNEFHFRELKGNNRDELNRYIEFFDLLVRNGEMVSFKAVAVNRTKINRLSITDLLIKIYYQFVRLGVEHEINSERVSLPNKINVTKDQDDDSLFVIETMKQQLGDNFKLHFNDQLIMDQLVPMESRKNIFLQFADLFAASLNRKYNYKGNSNNNKDKLSKYILETVGINKITYNISDVEEESIEPINSDHSVLFLFD